MEPLSTATTTLCDNCRTVNDSTLKFCPQCSYPMGGTADEKRNFLQHIGSRKRLLKNAEEKINSAKNIIYIIAGFTFLMGLYMGFGLGDYTTMIINLVLCLLYMIMVAWSAKNPFGAILTAFIIYITLNILNAFIDPTTLFSGIIVKVLFIGGFIKGIRSAQEAQGYLTELENFKAAPVGDR